MLEPKIRDALNDQMIFEMFSANIYLSMAMWCDDQNLSGFAAWMKAQYHEEMFHAMKLYDYIVERGERATMEGIEAPATEWASPLAVFEDALEHEKLVSRRINDIVALASDQKDYATVNFLQWFVAEQVEEEATADGVVQKLRMVEGAPGGLFMLDRELGQRSFSPPAAE